MKNGQGLIPICGNKYEPYSPAQLPNELRKLNGIEYNGILFQSIATKLKAFFPDKNKTTNQDLETNTEANRILERALLILEDRDFKKAIEYFEKVLSLNCNCTEALIGKFLASNNVTNVEELKQLESPFTNQPEFIVLCGIKNNDTIENIKKIATILEDNAVVKIRAEQIADSLKESGFCLFGEYPQTDVTAKLGKELKKYLTLDPSYHIGWTGYKYRTSENHSDFMWYKDVNHTDGNRYRAVYLSDYRSRYSDNEVDYSNNNAQEKNGYHRHTVYWFRFDPIRWNLLNVNKENLEAILISNVILDSQAYNDKGKKQNNYETSTIRAWLNNDFYELAFSQNQKPAIKEVMVDNSERSSNPDESPKEYNEGVNKNACTNTYDKIRLLSVQEATTAAYGFNPDPNEKDEAFSKENSDYSKFLGMWSKIWWLRSPVADDEESAWNIGLFKNLDNDTVNEALRGVVPVLSLDLKQVLPNTVLTKPIDTQEKRYRLKLVGYDAKITTLKCIEAISGLSFPEVKKIVDTNGVFLDNVSEYQANQLIIDLAKKNIIVQKEEI